MGLAPWAADVLGADDPSGRRCGNAMLHKDERGDAFTVHRTLQVQCWSGSLRVRVLLLSRCARRRSAAGRFCVAWMLCCSLSCRVEWSRVERRVE